MKISEDQNEITTDDGIVHVFVETRGICCIYCSVGCYNDVPCYEDGRKDNKDGYFKLKTE